MSMQGNDEAYSTQYPNFLSKDGKLYSFESSSFVDHPPMILNDGRVVSFDKINSVGLHSVFHADIHAQRQHLFQLNRRPAALSHLRRSLHDSRSCGLPRWAHDRQWTLLKRTDKTRRRRCIRCSDYLAKLWR